MTPAAPRSSWIPDVLRTDASPVTIRAGYGLFLLTAPERLLAAGAPGRAPGWARPVVRLLGARHLLQAAVLAVRPELARPGSLVDLTHASTDVLCALLIPPLRTPALLDTAVATGLAFASTLIAR